MTMTEKVHSIQKAGETMTEAVHRIQKDNETMTEAIHGISGAPVPPVSIPAKPTITVTGTTETEINVSWNQVQDATNYVIDVQTNGTSIPGYPDAVSVTTAKIANLTPNTSYDIKVKACNKDSKCSADATKTLKTASTTKTTQSTKP